MWRWLNVEENAPFNFQQLGFTFCKSIRSWARPYIYIYISKNTQILSENLHRVYTTRKEKYTHRETDKEINLQV